MRVCEYFATFFICQDYRGCSNCRHCSSESDLDVSQVWLLWELDITADDDGGGGFEHSATGVTNVPVDVPGDVPGDVTGDMTGDVPGDVPGYVHGDVPGEGSIVVVLHNDLGNDLCTAQPFVVFQHREHGNLSGGFHSLQRPEQALSTTHYASSLYHGSCPLFKPLEVSP